MITAMLTAFRLLLCLSMLLAPLTAQSMSVIIPGPGVKAYSGGADATVTWQGAKTDNSIQTTYTYTSSPVGSGTRKIVIVVFCEGNGSQTINSATVAGNSMTAATATNGGSAETTRQFYYDATGSVGSSVTITVTYSGAVGSSYISIYTIQNAALGGPTSTVLQNSAGVLTVTMSTNVNAGGVVIGSALSRNGTGSETNTWTNLTKDWDVDVDGPGSGAPGSSASAAFASAQTGLSITDTQTGSISGSRGIYGTTSSWAKL